MTVYRGGQYPDVVGPPFVDSLYEHLTEHVTTERTMLTRYLEVVEQSESKAFRFLIELLVEDEKRHHGLFEQWANVLKGILYGKVAEPQIPPMDFDKANSGAVLDGARELLANEKRDLAELKQLKRTIRDYRDTTLWSVLVEIMIRDTQKHIAILDFVCKHAK